MPSSAIPINSVATGSFRGIEALASKRGVHSLRSPRSNRTQSPGKGPRCFQVSLCASAMIHIASRNRSQWSRIASYESYRTGIWSGLARRTIAQTLSHPDAKAPQVGNNTWTYTKKFTFWKTKFDQLGTTRTPVATTVEPFRVSCRVLPGEKTGFRPRKCPVEVRLTGGAPGRNLASIALR